MVSALAPTLLMKFPFDARVMEPPAEITPFTVMLLLDTAVRLLPTVEAAIVNAVLLVNCTALAPELLSDTAPVKLFPALVRVMVFAPALMVAWPALAACTIAPVCEIA